MRRAKRKIPFFIFEFRISNNTAARCAGFSKFSYIYPLIESSTFVSTAHPVQLQYDYITNEVLPVTSDVPHQNKAAATSKVLPIFVIFVLQSLLNIN